MNHIGRKSIRHQGRERLCDSNVVWLLGRLESASYRYLVKSPETYQLPLLQSGQELRSEAALRHDACVAGVKNVKVA